MGEIDSITWLWLSVMFLFGTFAYQIDKHLGIKVRNYFRKLFSNPETFEYDNKGFLYKRRVKTKIFYGTVLTGILSFILFIFGTVALETKIIMFGFEALFFNIGIFLGPLYIKGKNYLKNLLNRLDKVEEKMESQDFDLNKEVQSKVNEVYDNVNENIGKTYQSVKEKTENYLKETKNNIDELKENIEVSQTEKEQKKNIHEKKYNEYKKSSNKINEILNK